MRGVRGYQEEIGRRSARCEACGVIKKKSDDGQRRANSREEKRKVQTKLETDARKARIDELEKDALHDKKIISDLRGDGQGAEGATRTDSSRRCKGLDSSEFGQVRGARGLVAKKEKAQDGTSVEVFRASQCDLSMKGEGPRCVCLLCV